MREAKGFTLIEVIIVTAVIGVLAAIAIPSYLNWLPNYRLKGAARNLYFNLQKAKALAVKGNQSAAVLFDTANNSYTICDNWSGTSPCAGNSEVVDLNTVGSGVGFGHGNASSAVGGAGFDNDVTYSTPVDIAVFNSHGFGNAGYVYLDHQDGNTTYAIGSVASGGVRILKWQGGGWK